MFSSGCCGRPRVLKRHSTRHRFEVLSRKKLIKRVLNLSEEPVRDTFIITASAKVVKASNCFFKCICNDI